MGKKSRENDNDTQPLTPEDAVLWEQVSGTAEPLRKGENRARDQPRPAMEDIPPSAPAAARRPAPRNTPAAKSSAKPAPAPPLATLERRAARGLRAGRVSVDARIDLHGHRQLEAHGVLKSFLARAQASGRRHVLVITGKGGPRGGDGRFERGVLNREVPRWLADPAFRQWVVSFAPAHQRHGGEGALYVRLRRQGRRS